MLEINLDFCLDLAWNFGFFETLDQPFRAVTSRKPKPLTKTAIQRSKEFFTIYFFTPKVNHSGVFSWFTLISLKNVKSRLLILENSTLHVYWFHYKNFNILTEPSIFLQSFWAIDLYSSSIINGKSPVDSVTFVPLHVFSTSTVIREMRVCQKYLPFLFGLCQFSDRSLNWHKPNKNGRYSWHNTDRPVWLWWKSHLDLVSSMWSLRISEQFGVRLG